MRYMLICNYCGQKHFTNGDNLDGLVEVKSAAPPKKADGKNKEIQELPRKFRCYNCGMLFKVVKLATDEKPPKKEPPVPEPQLEDWEKEVLKSIRKKPLA